MSTLKTQLFLLFQIHFMICTRRKREKAIRMTLGYILAGSDWRLMWRETGPLMVILSVSLPIAFRTGLLSDWTYGWQSGGHPSKEETESLLKMLDGLSHDQAAPGCRTQVHSLVRSELGETLPLHISLSRPITLATHQRQPFIDRITSEVSRYGVRQYVPIEPLHWTWNLTMNW